MAVGLEAGLFGPLEEPLSLELYTQDYAGNLEAVLHKQTFVGLYHQGCIEELVAGWYFQQGKVMLATQQACVLDIVAVPLLLQVDWLDSNELVLEGCSQAVGSGLYPHCGVDSNAGVALVVVFHLNTDVELKALELFVLVEKADWQRPVGQLEGKALLQAQHEFDRGADLVSVGNAVGTWVALSFSDPELDKEAVLQPHDLWADTAEEEEEEEVLLLEWAQDKAEK